MAASQDLRKLRDLGLVTQKGKGSATYYLPGPEFPHETPVRGSLATEQATLAGKHTTLAGKLTTLAGEHTTLAGEHTTLAPKHTTLRKFLPESLRHQVDDLGQRPGEKSRTVILLLCAWKPLSSNELAEILGRKDSEAIRRDHLKPLIEEGRLAYVYPEMERHPEQAYRTVGRINL